MANDKPIVGGRAKLGSVTEVPPYSGAKPHFLLGEELDDQLEIVELIRLTARELPSSAPKKAKPEKAKI
ncbi:hypothetical protein [Candidatus Thiothrix anitrata]|uniref:Uncharacterized protein n=1 Tax=Candidatus Thiothrix anitrata TaxID=2823902 RepID=A0ABX7X5W8_9GAMM|nr:hypothetical protein [Candidatus Thiothrix anitrata]QTR51259.1 hypothetical protein J8380_06835 [Candidatus Thiothrix anitrata]